MKRLLFSTIAVVLAGMILAACTQTAGPPPAAQTGPAAAAGAAESGKGGWQEQWNGLVAEAKKEASLTIYSMWTSEVRTALTRAFREKYSIDLEFSAFGKGEELAVKFEAERRAGLHLADVFGVGGTTMFSYMKPQGMLGPMKPLLTLPEVLDPKVWMGGAIPFYDKDGQTLALIGSAIKTVAYNTDLVREREITTYKDLLKPQFKGKITMLDPSTSGASSLIHAGQNLWGEAEVVDFLRRLIKDQEVVITRDNRLHIESVARGKYAVAFAPSQTTLPVFIKAGAPLKMAPVVEDNRLSGSSGAMGISPRPAHPNATAVFLNWLLTKEGMSIFATSYGNPSTRLDASTEGIDPALIPVPGQKYFLETEEWMQVKDRWMEIFGRVMKETAR
ncbi:MAG: extracellular solute-binding protein [Chloroflexi bacterium]|nr:extracellular solute-binding protein [Chloroflexota bacterium]